MKFVYEYRTSDNVPHRGEVCATDREAAFAVLRGRGIRPARLAEAPGFFNKVMGRGKHWIAIAVLLLVVAGLLWALQDSRRQVEAVLEEETPTVVADPYEDNGFARPIERRQIWGDEAVIEQAASKNWRVIFANPADRLLSLFAQPGYLLPVFPRVPSSIHADFEKALAERTAINANDLDEYRQMKCIVEGMKVELRQYLAAGGNLDGYFRRLVARQKEEAAFIERAQKDLEARIEKGEDAFAAWYETNKMLRDQGLKSVALPAALSK